MDSRVEATVNQCEVDLVFIMARKKWNTYFLNDVYILASATKRMVPVRRYILHLTLQSCDPST